MSASNVVKFYPSDAAKCPDNVLEQAAGEFPGGVLILGFDESGDIEARASTNINVGDILLMIERFKADLVAGNYHE